jgi:proton-translocating NAD(P)+ transhydrogenase subunit beta
VSRALVDVAYLVAAVLFVVALKGLSHPRKAVRGNGLGALGMAIAVVATLVDQRIVRFDLILAGILVGGAVGLLLASQIRMTAMPELVALFNGLGGGASALVAGSALVASPPSALELATATVVSGFVGTVTFSGSLMAMAKLWGVVGDRRFGPVLDKLPVVVFGLGAVVLGFLVVAGKSATLYFGWLVVASTLLGIFLVAPIGGADMPVVISFLNACSGLAAAATGFVLMNQALIVSGSLVGASGLILTRIMCRAMNRGLGSVLFSPVGERGPGGEGGYAGSERPVKSASAEEVAMVLEAARRVVIVPGYGMAVAQAQRAVSDLARKLERRGLKVEFAIHPVAGRMPGHMNVLLAEADVPYDHLKDIDAINPELADCDVALVIGANDVVNPSARTDRGSPLYGMPILDVDRASTVVVLKRSLRAGFAGVDNPLFTAPNTVMLFGDAKQTVLALIDALEQGA